MSTVLELRGVSKSFGAHRAADNVSFSIEKGCLFALVGPSGCGKTTTLRMVAGFESPDSGDVILNGQRINDLPPYRRNVSTVFQSYALFPHLTARENIEFGLQRAGAKDLAGPVAKMIELLSLHGKQDRRPAQLSGGEKQRVALARSLVIEPDVLLLDEPLSALDPNLRKQVRLELKALQRRTGITFVMVTHDRDEALSMADQIGIMNRGNLEQVGSPRELYLQPATRFVAGFLGSVNWMGEVGVRPECVRVESEASSRSRAAVVRDVVFLGNCTHVISRLDSGEEVLAEIAGSGVLFSAGQSVHLSWNTTDELRPRS